MRTLENKPIKTRRDETVLKTTLEKQAHDLALKLELSLSDREQTGGRKRLNLCFGFGKFTGPEKLAGWTNQAAIANLTDLRLLAT